MATSWISALKMVPWNSVIESAPQLVKAAKKLFANTRTGTTETRPPASGSPDDPAIDRLNRLETITSRLSTEQETSAECIRSLVGQNERIIETVTILHNRIRMLLVVCSSLAGAVLWLILK